ncbi:hypothetical protein [Corynebacterium alimapuense]|uniref:Cell wall-active antibiotics response LiaF-like C-terminal domain-containing protein n=1 Tax=Corynebacterium alimapuense TaxID=1576874 RepID=A0A3M8KAL0_9CORY|nr:hypothetical protein [Corynebacterium alimapuense]RNE49562.1 hypothetical protein C5L39_04220 [Corynebacterium alimapuense]
MINPLNSRSPKDEDRQALQNELTRLVGAGQLSFPEFDDLSSLIWSTEDPTTLDAIRNRFFPTQAHPVVKQPEPPQPVRPQPMAQPLPPQQQGHTLSSNLGTIRRSGQWTVPEYTQFRLKGATLHLDLCQALASAPVITFHLDAMFSTIEIILPPGVILENQLQESWSSSDINTTTPATGGIRLIISGTTKGSSLSVKTKDPEAGSGLWKWLTEW